MIDFNASFSCLESDGQAPGCQYCPVRNQGFCDKFRLVLRKIAGNLESKYTGIPPVEREDILTNTVEGVIKGVKTYEGRHGAKFATWVWQIYRNKINDYFREKKTYSIEKINRENNESYNPSNDIEIKIAISECFKKHLADDDTGCVRLYLDLYSFFQKGRSQKELAAIYNLSPNTLNQRIKRCRKVMKNMFMECLDI